MPSRIVREGINSSARINELSQLGEIFYRRLMNVADDYGRFYASPVTLRAHCWPTCPERFTDQQVQEMLNECLTGDNPLIIMYESSGCRYLEVQNFGQQTRSKSKFPDPKQNKVLINCKSKDINGLSNAQPSRISESESNFDSRISEAIGVPETGYSLISPASWELDETYIQFATLSKQFWPRILNEEIAGGHRWYWTKFSIPEKLTAINNIKLRIEAKEDGEYVKHMPDYLKSEWKRGPKPPPARAEDVNDKRRNEVVKIMKITGNL